MTEGVSRAAIGATNGAARGTATRRGGFGGNGCRDDGNSYDQEGAAASIIYMHMGRCAASSSDYAETVTYTVTVHISSCIHNATRVSGDEVRMCQSDGVLSGTPLVCSHSTTPVNGSSHAIFYCTVAPIILFFVVLFPIDFYWYKQRKRKNRETFGHHMESARVGEVKAGIDQMCSCAAQAEPPAPKKISRIKGLLQMLRFKRSSTSPEIVRSSTRKITPHNSVPPLLERDEAPHAPDTEQPITKPIRKAFTTPNGLGTDVTSQPNSRYTSATPPSDSLSNGRATPLPGIKNGDVTRRSGKPPIRSASSAAIPVPSPVNPPSPLYDDSEHLTKGAMCAHGFDVDEEFGMPAYTPRYQPNTKKKKYESLPDHFQMKQKFTSSPFIRIAGTYDTP